jgi:hypothetical protein
MADTIEKRVFDLEYLLAHLPEDLDARFAGADARVGARFDQLSIRLQTIETRVRHVEQAEANNGARLQALDSRVARVDAGLEALGGRVAQVEARLEALGGQIDGKLAALDAKLDEILSRLPPRA